MNQKELSELKRRFRPDKSAIHRIYGCFVNGNQEIVSYLDESMGRMPEEESAQYLGFLKKTLSGTWASSSSTLSFPPSRWRTARSTSSSPPCGTPS